MIAAGRGVCAVAADRDRVAVDVVAVGAVRGHPRREQVEGDRAARVVPARKGRRVGQGRSDRSRSRRCRRGTRRRHGVGSRGAAVVGGDEAILGMIEDVGAVWTVRVVVLARLQLGDRRAADKVDLVVAIRNRDRQGMSPRREGPCRLLIDHLLIGGRVAEGRSGRDVTQQGELVIHSGWYSKGDRDRVSLLRVAGQVCHGLAAPARRGHLVADIGGRAGGDLIVVEVIAGIAVAGGGDDRILGIPSVPPGPPPVWI